MPMKQKVLSASSLGWIPCVWHAMHGEMRPGFEMHKTVFHEHANYWPDGTVMSCDHPLACHINFVFCSETCRQYFLHSHISMGDLPKGYKNLAWH